MFALRLFCLIAPLLATTSAHPGMRAVDDILRRVPQVADEVNTRMIGDLATTGPATAVGRSVANILLRKESAETSATMSSLPLIGSLLCRADPCCVWSSVSTALTLAFTGPTGRCNDLARAWIRLGFHDAGTWSATKAAAGQDFGGADGSIALSADEINRPENNGLQDAIRKARQMKATFPSVSMADLIQFGAQHAVVTCPLGPRIRFFAGRKDSSKPALDGLLPSSKSDADTLIALFEDKTISAHELAALVGAHTTSRQFFDDPTKVGFPQDSTPGVWDTKFYNETLVMDKSRIARFPSDIALAKDPRMSAEWAKFQQGNGVGQDHWNEDYATAAVRLSLLGVNNINSMTECSKALPPARPDFITTPFFLQG